MSPLFMPAAAALWFLPFVTPIAFFVAWSDLRYMRIPNEAVLTLVAVFAVVGVFVLSLEDYLWRWSHLLVVLVISFVMTAAKTLGAGDAKFASAMAPFFAAQDIMFIAFLFMSVSLAALATHRVVRQIPAIREQVPDWKSWKAAKFPMGLALGTMLFIYLLVASIYGS
ncbi:MAG: prepilin peptidase [Pseudomonadota bacterium]